MTRNAVPHLADVSKYQGVPSVGAFTAAARAGLKGVYVRATFSASGPRDHEKDPDYDATRANVAKAGLRVGAYIYADFAYAGGAAVADAFLAQAQIRPGDLAPMLDVETTGGLSTGVLTARVGAFLDRVEARIGVRPLLYAAFDFPTTFGATLWQPRYNNAMEPPVTHKPWAHWGIWQFTDGKYGSPNHIAGLGHVDLSTIAGNADAFLTAHTVPSAKTAKAKAKAKTTQARAAVKVARAQHKAAVKAGAPANRDKMDPRAYTKGVRSGNVKWLGKRLIAHGYKAFYPHGAHTVYGPEDVAAVQAFQRAQGWTGADADGFPGHDTLNRLAAPPLPANPVARVLAVAAGEVGYTEGFANGHWDNHQKYSPAIPGLEWSQDQAWCQTFVTWVAMTAGVQALFGDPAHPTASTITAAAWYRAHGQWHTSNPKPGDQVFFGEGTFMHHTGIVVATGPGYVLTIEGNTNSTGSSEGNQVLRKRRLLVGGGIAGFGRPNYAAATPVKAPKPVPAPNPVHKPVHNPAPAPAPKPATVPAPPAPATAARTTQEEYAHQIAYIKTMLADIQTAIQALERGNAA